MQKIKLFIGLLVYLVIGLFSASARTILASVLSIQTLPSYVTTNSFKLSCTANGNSAQFYFRKEGSSYSAFGPSINLLTTPCLVQVASSEVTEESKFYFKVNVDGTDSFETSTIYDNSGPSAVSGFYKDGLTDGYRLHYHTPSDSDFDKVIIYRDELVGFSADSSHEIATVNGSPNTDMTYEDHSGTGKFYLIRALDHAGNSSGLAGDVGTTTSLSTAPTGNVLGAKTNSGGKVVILPKNGSVLSGKTEASPTPEATVTPAPETGKTGPANWILTHKKISIGVALVLIVAGYLLFRKKNS